VSTEWDIPIQISPGLIMTTDGFTDVISVAYLDECLLKYSCAYLEWLELGRHSLFMPKQTK